jgi:hypothetical protein
MDDCLRAKVRGSEFISIAFVSDAFVLNANKELRSKRVEELRRKRIQGLG